MLIFDLKNVLLFNSIDLKIIYSIYQGNIATFFLLAINLFFSLLNINEWCAPAGFHLCPA